MRLVITTLVLLSAVSGAHAQDDSQPPLPPEAPQPPQPRQAQPPELSGPTLQRALRRYRHEPRVGEVVAAALRALGTRDPARMAARARAAGWVPRVSLRARRGQAVDLSDAGDSVRLSTDDDLTLEAGLVFELDRLVFRREETTIFRDARGAQQARRQLTREVIALYFERRRLQLERDLLGAVGPQHLMRIAELEAVLDAFTNGAFLAMMGDPQWRTEGSTPATTPRSPQRSSSMATPWSARRGTSRKAASPSSSPSPSTRAAASSSP